MKKKVIAIALGLIMTAGGMGGVQGQAVQVQETSVENVTCEAMPGNNIEKQNYATWASTVRSYLCDVGNGELMRVQYDAGENQVGVSYYDASYQVKKHADIALELPVFGGFYQSSDAYFVVSGQDNPTESDDTEVIRITKYDKQWNRIASCSLYGANTYEPFQAGSLRMTDDGTYLFVRTCHTMYMSNDGKHHQANVTIQVDMNKMQITDSFADIMNTSYGYVSHSFNQFIRVENGNLIAVDHGDAYPRSICLVRYNTDASDGTFVPDWDSLCDVYNVITFEGNIGDNYTGASVGGFEVSDTSYLIAGNNTSAYGKSNAARNIFVASVSKETSEVKVTELTSYGELEEGASTPQFISLGDGTFLLLWSSEGMVYYVRIDGKGSQIGTVMHMEGQLSDCVPVIWNDRVVWYTVEEEQLMFYEISYDSLSDARAVEGISGHHYVNQGVVDGMQSQKCDKCGVSRQIPAITDYNVWWNMTGPWESYSSHAPSQVNVGERVYYWAQDQSENKVENGGFVVELSEEACAEIYYENDQKTMGNIMFKKPGQYTVTIYPRMNPELKKETTIAVVGIELSDTTVLGDFNDDKKVDLKDAQGVLKVALNIIQAPENADLDADRDGRITLSDAQLILKAALNIISLDGIV